MSKRLRARLERLETAKADAEAFCNTIVVLPGETHDQALGRLGFEPGPVDMTMFVQRFAEDAQPEPVKRTPLVGRPAGPLRVVMADDWSREDWDLTEYADCEGRS